MDSSLRGLDDDISFEPAFAKDVRVDRHEEIEYARDHLMRVPLVKSMPDMIVKDWMYLGSMMHARDFNVVQQLGITHILNCSSDLPCWHIKDESIHYGRISLDDVESSNIGYYFKAAASFIDECNPKYTTSSPPNRILIHCAAGVSRSSTIVISYLLHRVIDWSEMERDCLNIIRLQLLHRKGKQNEQNALKLSVAYRHVESCRPCIGPNEGFLEQLERFEKEHHDGKSTREELPEPWHQMHEENKEMMKAINERRDQENEQIEEQKDQTEQKRTCLIL